LTSVVVVAAVGLRLTVAPTIGKCVTVSITWPLIAAFDGLGVGVGIGRILGKGVVDGIGKGDADGVGAGFLVLEGVADGKVRRSGGIPVVVGVTPLLPRSRS